MKNKPKKPNPFQTSFNMGIILIICFVIATIIVIALISVLNLFEQNLVQNNVLLLATVCLIACLIVGSILSTTIASMTGKQLQKIRVVLNELSKGNYTKKIPVPKQKNIFHDIIVDFNKTIDKLNSTVTLQNNFTSNFSHEFKTPIVSIKGYAEILRDNPNLPKEEFDKYLKIIIAETERLTNLSTSTLLISKLDSMQSIELNDVVKLDEQIEECILLLDNNLQTKNIDVELNLSRQTILANSDMLKEVWINLLTNAIKYNKVNGKITINLKKAERYIVISISDTGMGMDEKTQEHIFDKYFQGDSSHYKKGNGLGLSISRRIIELCGGTIKVSSKIDSGTTFTIMFPASTKKA